MIMVAHVALIPIRCFLLFCFWLFLKENPEKDSRFDASRLLLVSFFLIFFKFLI